MPARLHVPEDGGLRVGCAHCNQQFIVRNPAFFKAINDGKKAVLTINCPACEKAFAVNWEGRVAKRYAAWVEKTMEAIAYCFVQYLRFDSWVNKGLEKVGHALQKVTTLSIRPLALSVMVFGLLFMAFGPVVTQGPDYLTGGLFLGGIWTYFLRLELKYLWHKTKHGEDAQSGGAIARPDRRLFMSALFHRALFGLLILIAVLSVTTLRVDVLLNGTVLLPARHRHLDDLRGPTLDDRHGPTAGGTEAVRAEDSRACLGSNLMPSQRDYDYNINDNVLVRLTPAGHRAYNEYYERLFADYASEFGIPEIRYVEIEGERWAKFQIWGFMQIFGPAIYMGMTEGLFLNNHIKFPESGHFVVRPRESRELERRFPQLADSSDRPPEDRIDLLMQG